MRALYSLAWGLALPLVLGRLWWCGRKEAGYRRHVWERLGFYRGAAESAQDERAIWLHAVSVGETRACAPLVEALLTAYPKRKIVLTHMTPTGRETGRALFEKYGSHLRQCYLPYDMEWIVHRFIRHFRPGLCILMETEVWPNLIACCVKSRVPVTLVNARLSERSLAKARRLPEFMTQAAKGMTLVAAQTAFDAERLRKLEVPNVHVTGSVKFDIAVPNEAIRRGEQWRARFGLRPTLLCASTREGEETLILDALEEASGHGAWRDGMLLIIVPRHPQRFDEVARQVEQRGLKMQRRSAFGSGALASDVRVLLGDSMGELFSYYAACDLAFIGGSLLPLGGQNLIEACMLGKPVLIGPHTFNFSVISDDAVAAGAALRVEDARAMVEQATQLFQQETARLEMGKKAEAFALQHRGATQRTMELLAPLLSR